MLVTLRTSKGESIDLTLPENYTVRDLKHVLQHDFNYIPSVQLMYSTRIVRDDAYVDEFPPGSLIVVGNRAQDRRPQQLEPPMNSLGRSSNRGPLHPHQQPYQTSFYNNSQTNQHQSPQSNRQSQRPTGVDNRSFSTSRCSPPQSSSRPNGTSSAAPQEASMHQTQDNAVQDSNEHQADSVPPHDQNRRSSGAETEIEVYVIIPALQEKLVTIRIMDGCTVSDFCKELAALEVSTRGCKLVFFNKYITNKQALIRQVPLQNGSIVFVSSGIFLQPECMTMYLVERALREVYAEIKIAHENPDDCGRSPSQGGVVGVLLHQSTLAVQKEEIDAIDKTSLPIKLRNHWNEKLMKALLEVDVLEGVEGDLRIRRKEVVKTITNLQDSLLENKEESM